MALGFPIIFYGVIYHTTAWGKAMMVLGVLISLSAVIGWAMEPLEEAPSAHEEHVEDEHEEVMVDD
jgi:hypothetical protein